MRIDVSEVLKHKGAQKSFSADLDLSRLDDDLLLEGKIRLSGEFERTDTDTVALRAVAKGRVQLKCSRCLSDFILPIEVDVFETYRKGSTAGPDDPSIPFEGESIDPTEAVRETIILALPVKPLCREDCQGICQVCGQDLNEGSCECRSDDIDPRLAALEDFFKE